MVELLVSAYIELGELIQKRFTVLLRDNLELCKAIHQELARSHAVVSLIHVLDELGCELQPRHLHALLVERALRLCSCDAVESRREGSDADEDVKDAEHTRVPFGE